MKSVGIFVDISNLFYNINKKYPGKKLDYFKYRLAAVGDEALYRAVGYGYFVDFEARKFVSALKHVGYETKYRKHRTIVKDDKIEYLNSSWNLAMSLDIIRVLPKLDKVVLGTSDPEICPFVEYLKEKGVECFVISSNIPKGLRNSATQCIEITEDLLHATTQ